MRHRKQLHPDLEQLFEPLHPGPCTTSDGKQPPFEVGRQAGAAVRRLLANRADHITTSVEWYRGFCAACGKQPDPKVEAFIANEIRQVAAGADARHPVTVVATAMASAHVADITEILERPKGDPR